MKSAIRAFLPLVVGLTASACAVNPATGNNQLMLVSEAQEIEMGRQADAAVVQTIGLEPARLMVVPATAPLRTPEDLDRCLDEFARGDVDRGIVFLGDDD